MGAKLAIALVVRGLGVLLLVGVTSGCVTRLPVLLPSQADPLQAGESLVFGRVLAILTAPSTRTYEPEIRFFELLNRSSGERFVILVGSRDQVFAVKLPVGHYELSRVQISEGPFMSMADLEASFQVGADPIVYLGTWRFGVDQPRYGRMVLLSLVQDQEDRGRTEREILARFPALSGRPISTLLPAPATSESRLYEVMPYPRYSPYYRRHWW